MQGKILLAAINLPQCTISLASACCLAATCLADAYVEALKVKNWNGTHNSFWEPLMSPHRLLVRV